MLRNAVSLPVRALRLLLDSLRWDKPFMRNVFVVALPMVIQQLVTASLHIVDGLMVSGLGDAAYSAVTQANRVTFMFNLFSFGTCTGGAIFFKSILGWTGYPPHAAGHGADDDVCAHRGGRVHERVALDAPSDHIAVSAAGREL